MNGDAADEDRLAQRLEQLHDRVRSESKTSQADEIGESTESDADSQRLLQLLHLLKPAGSRHRASASGSARSSPDERHVGEPHRSDQGKHTPVRQTQQPTVGTHQDQQTEPFSKTMASTVRLELPDRIGRFQIREMVGQGGFGIVYRAHDPVLQRDVALKIPRLTALLDPGSRERFVQEAQAAAALAHPAIVAVFESGQSGPVCHLACEFVEGLTLADWLQKRKAPVNASAAAGLLVTLADALQHAHDRGVIHRDIKPANILLEAPDGQPDESRLSAIAKISDFGLARFVESDVNQTQSGSLLGTPAYMSPEQVRADRLAVGPASDVYSLGLLGYELLTQSNPFVRDSVFESIQAVQSFDPPCPHRINRGVPADLSAIVMKCMEKRTVDRYASASALRADLERFLRNEPVSASPQSTLVRMRKWMERNRAVAALLVLLAMGIGGTTLGMLRARSAELDARDSESRARIAASDARAAEEQARVEAATATAVSEFLEDMFDVSDILGAKDQQQRNLKITAEEILQQGAKRIETELQDQPTVRARLMTRIGYVLGQLGDYDNAEPLLRQALALRKEILVGDSPELAECHRRLGVLLTKSDHPREAELELLTAISIFKIDPTANHRHLSGSFNDLGLLLKTTDPHRAREAYTKARNLLQEFQPDSKTLWILDANIARLDWDAGQHDLALQSWESALKRATGILGGDNPKLAGLYNNLSVACRTLGRYREAVAYSQRDIDLMSANFGDDHEHVGTGLMGLSSLQRQMGDLEGALQSANRSIEIMEARLPPHHQYLTLAMNNLALTLLQQRKFDLARQVTERIERQLASRNDSAAETQKITNSLVRGQIERYAGDLDAAKEQVEWALAHDVNGNKAALEMDARFLLALILVQQGEETAGDVFSDALQFAERVPGLLPEVKAFLQAQYFSISRKTDQALTQLERAVALGYSDARLFVEPDFDSIRQTDRFRNLESIVRDRVQVSDLE